MNNIKTGIIFPSRISQSTVVQLLLLVLIVLLSIPKGPAFASTNAIESIRYSSLPGNRLQIIFGMAQQASKPLSFTIDNPARIAFDFPDTISRLPQRSQNIGVGNTQSVTAISTKDKTRVILNLTEVVPYQVHTEGKQVFITLEGDATAQPDFVDQTSGQPSTAASRFTKEPRGVKSVDFRRGERGEGRVIISISEPNIPLDINQEYGKVVVNLLGAQIPKSLHQRLDVLDFATPVKAISSFPQDNNTRIEIEPVSGDYEYLAYQSDKVITIELKPISKEELEEINKEKFGYVGERLSLNFQDIPIRAVLQLIADFTSLNVVVSDSVAGNLTLRLKNVPWDQALDIILKSKGLSKRESGNVILIAPSEEVAAQEKIDLEARQKVEELAPLETAFIEVNFAKVTELQKLFEGEQTLLSPRGYAIIDERTNSLMLKDTGENLNEVRRILTRLDVPVRQVLVESRIVIANEDFTKEFGTRFGATLVDVNGSGITTTSGSAFGTNTSVGSALDNLNTTGSPGPVEIGSLNERLNVNLPVVGAAGSFALAILGSDHLLDLELSALHAEKNGEIISSPRVITADRREAFIEQGVEIPYLSASSSGATRVEFKKAVLSIKVVPQITPDDRIILDLTVNKDSVGQVFSGIPSVDTREVSTQVLVNNGETVVLGGIYETTSRDEITKVPVLGDLPLVGSLFRHNLRTDEKDELLIFVTPKILKDALSL